jgi:hypothetical protein
MANCEAARVKKVNGVCAIFKNLSQCVLNWNTCKYFVYKHICCFWVRFASPKANPMKPDPRVAFCLSRQQISTMVFFCVGAAFKVDDILAF